jgi:hypothetical protein
MYELNADRPLPDRFTARQLDLRLGDLLPCAPAGYHSEYWFHLLSPDRSTDGSLDYDVNYVCPQTELRGDFCAFFPTRGRDAFGCGDFLDKPIAKGSLELSRYSASAALLVAIVLCILMFPQQQATRGH